MTVFLSIPIIFAVKVFNTKFRLSLHPLHSLESPGGGAQGVARQFFLAEFLESINLQLLSYDQLD